MRLFWKIYGVVFILFVAVIASSSYVTSTIRISDAEKSIAEEHRTIGSFIASDIERRQSESKWPFESLKRLSEDSDFIFWWIVKEDGIIHLADKASFIGLCSYDYFPQIAGMSPDDDVILNNRQNYGLFIKSFRNGEQRWTFWLGFSTKHIAQANRKIILSTVVYSASALVILGLVLYFVIIHFLRPVKSLTAGVEKIGKGELNYRVEAESNDELGYLARSFNKMSEELQGTTTSVDNLNREITERKKAEEALQESEEKFKLIYETSSDAIMILKPPTWRFTLGNSAIVKMFEVKNEKEFISLRPWEVSPKYQPDGQLSAAKAKKMIETAMKKGKNFFEWIHQTVQGKGFFATVLLNRIEMKGKAFLQARVTDITERKQAEEALRESERRFKQVAECAGEWIWEINADGLYTYASPVVEKMLGYKPKEIVGKKYFYNFFTPDVKDELKRNAFSAFSKKRSFRGFVNFNVHKNGSIVIMETSGTPVLDYAGNLVGYRGLDTDITERKQAEVELKAAQEKLIETAHRAGMAEVAADVLHNVGNVLNSINVSTTVIREKVTSSELANLEKVAGIINEHTDDLGTFLTEDPQGKHIPVYLTEVSKCLTDEQTDIISRLRALVDNVQHIEDIIGMQQSYAKVSGVEVQTSISKLAEDAIQINSTGLERHGTRLIREFEELGDVEIDKQKVLQILVNLISNAKYALSGSNREEKLLTIRIYKHGEGRFRIEVADNGVGISEDNLTKIFSYGFTTKKDGHGVGLHSSALAAKEMGGTLTVYSDGLGQGATFTLELQFKSVEVMK